MNSYMQRLQQNQIIIMDGGMGTLIQKYKLTDKDFDGMEGLNEILNLTHPEIIKEIHTAYLKAGAMAIETNSFGASRIKLAEYGKEDLVYTLNRTAALIAKEAIQEFIGSTKDQKLEANSYFVIGSMGPTGKLPSSTDSVLGNIGFDELADTFCEQAQALIEGGVDVLLLETQHDILEVKAGIVGCNKAIVESGRNIALQVQITVDSHGKMLYGTSILAAYNIIKDMDIDVFGINCSTGPEEMEASLRLLSKYSNHPISVLPNAGMPQNVNGKAVYGLSATDFAKNVSNFINNYGVKVAGGCCGTSPAHIQALRDELDKRKLTAPDIETTQQATSLVYASPIAISENPKNKKVFIIGERLNSQGSKKAKTLMLHDDYSSLLVLAREQESQGADFLDICFAMTERSDEKEQVSTFVNKVAYAVATPLVIDSTEPAVIEEALRRYAGKAIVNSINLENDKLHSLLPLVKKFGASVIALCIDAKGMAKTLEEKLSIATKIYDIAINQYKLQPEQLIYDPLTFTLATGEEEYKNSAITTLQAIKKIKASYPGVKTVLGVSNISFGLKPNARKILNLVFLEKAVEAGLDFAIFNSEQYQELQTLPKNEILKAENLIFNKNPQVLYEFVDTLTSREDLVSSKKAEIVSNLQPEDQLKEQILNRKSDKLILLLDELRKKYQPTQIINELLLPTMKIVGEKMDKGEIILPFVLESAEIMKKALTYLEPFLDKTKNVSKGTVILATVFGDVHDIGKNLVKTITANNGYRVIDLGKQVPSDTIIDAAVREKADAITLSALLVTTSKQMQIIVEKLHSLKLTIPVIIGGAAINQQFADRISLVNGTKYAGGVYYSKDAFSGLKILEEVINA